MGNGTNQLLCHTSASLQTSKTNKTEKCMLCVPFVAVLSMYTVGSWKCVSVEKRNKKVNNKVQGSCGENICVLVRIWEDCHF